MSESGIHGVRTTELQPYEDRRGSLLEVFRKSWFPGEFDEQLQANCSISAKGALRGLHFHVRQTDYWFPVSGRMRAALFDVRPDSPTSGLVELMEIHADDRLSLCIPPGVAHGFYALTDLTMIYIVNSYYTGEDEYGIAWDDPRLALDWGIDGSPIISERDAANPRFSDFPPEKLRKWFSGPDR